MLMQDNTFITNICGQKKIARIAAGYQFGCICLMVVIYFAMAV